MKRRCLTGLVLLGFILILAGSASAFFMNFEEGLGNDGGQIVGIPGVTFTNSAGLNWRYCDITTGGYNVTSVNKGVSYGTGYYNMYDYVCAWLGTSGNWGRIDFDDQNGTWFQTGVSSYSNFSVEAYDAADNLLDSASTGPCTRQQGYTDMVWLRVDAPVGQNISYVIVHDSGNYWEVDNMTGDMAGGTVPLPSSLVLLASGMIILLGYRKVNKV